MNRRIWFVVAGAVALFALALVASFALIGGDAGGANVHTMPDGSVMTMPMAGMSDDG